MTGHANVKTTLRSLSELDSIIGRDLFYGKGKL
jgi:hypothetical protein